MSYRQPQKVFFSIVSIYTGLLKMIIGVLTICHTQYTWDRVCSCTDGSRNSQSFLLWCAVCSSYAFLRLERCLLRCYSPGHLVLQMQPHVIYFYGFTSRIRFRFLLFPQVSRNWRYESERLLKPLPLTCYKKFGTNSFVVLMFVESQRVHI